MNENILTTETRARRAAYNAYRSKVNAMNPKLSAAGHRAVSMLSFIRHELHINQASLWVKSKAGRNYESLFRSGINVMLRSAGLPEIDVTDILDGMPDIEVAKELGLNGEWEMVAKTTCLTSCEQINNRLEDYLRYIDRVYGTWYAPSGIARKKVS